LMFHVPVRGNLVSILIIVMAGGMCFAGIGLLVASRAQRIETVSGLMNLVMLPMWLLSGIFFSTENFPDAIQPFIQALPLTQLNNALRAVILEGASLTSQWLPLVMLLAFALVSFYFALRLFRWT
jgi:ABC-2 type transport system permease protein